MLKTGDTWEEMIDRTVKERKRMIRFRQGMNAGVIYQRWQRYQRCSD